MYGDQWHLVTTVWRDELLQLGMERRMLLRTRAIVQLPAFSLRRQRPDQSLVAVVVVGPGKTGVDDNLHAGWSLRKLRMDEAAGSGVS